MHGCKINTHSRCPKIKEKIRNASLIYGILQSSNCRCIYQGWSPRSNPRSIVSSKMFNVVVQAKFRPYNSLKLLDEFHKSLLVHEACVLSTLENTQISQAQLRKALVDKVNGRVDVQRNRCLEDVSAFVSSTRRAWNVLGRCNG